MAKRSEAEQRRDTPDMPRGFVRIRSLAAHHTRSIQRPGQPGHPSTPDSHSDAQSQAGAHTSDHPLTHSPTICWMLPPPPEPRPPSPFRPQSVSNGCPSHGHQRSFLAFQATRERQILGPHGHDSARLSEVVSSQNSPRMYCTVQHILGSTSLIVIGSAKRVVERGGVFVSRHPSEHVSGLVPNSRLDLGRRLVDTARGIPYTGSRISGPFTS